MIHELVEGDAELLGPCLARLSQLLSGGVRRAYFVEPRQRTARHPPDVLDQAQPQHRRNRPQLADTQRRDALELAHEQLRVREVEMPLGVRDQLDRDLVHAGEARERPDCELGQLPVVAARERRANLANVLFDRVEIIEEPFTSRTYIDALIGRFAKRLSGLEQDAVGLFESPE